MKEWLMQLQIVNVILGLGLFSALSKVFCCLIEHAFRAWKIWYLSKNPEYRDFLLEMERIRSGKGSAVNDRVTSQVVKKRVRIRAISP